MAKAVQWRRGTTVQHATFTGLIGEITVDTDKDTLVIHDGVTAGGSPLATKAEVVALNEPTLVRKTSDIGAAILPVGSTAERPVTPQDGYIRYNTTLQHTETYRSSTGSWGTVGSSQFLGTADTKAIQFMAQATSEVLVAPASTNSFSIDSLVIENSGSLTIPTNSVYKVL